MFPKAPILSGALLALVSLPSVGQTYTADQTAPYDPGTYHTEAVYGVGNIDFNNSTGSGPNPYGVTPDFKITRVIEADTSQRDVFDVCVQMFVGPTGNSTYNVASGFGGLSADQANAARTLFSNTLGDFVIARNSLSPDADAIGAAIQIAFWEIVEDSVALSQLSLDDLGAFPGDLSIIGFTGGYAGTTADAVALAEGYLSNIRTSTWTDQGGYNYYYASAGTEQDRLWIAPIPEPSSALLGLFGGLLLVRRRR